MTSTVKNTIEHLTKVGPRRLRFMVSSGFVQIGKCQDVYEVSYVRGKSTDFLYQGLVLFEQLVEGITEGFSRSSLAIQRA
jgi:hypothetical protein